MSEKKRKIPKLGVLIANQLVKAQGESQIKNNRRFERKKDLEHWCDEECFLRFMRRDRTTIRSLTHGFGYDIKNPWVEHQKQYPQAIDWRVQSPIEKDVQELYFGLILVEDFYDGESLTKNLKE